MIEDKKIGLKIAENEDEAYYSKELKQLEESHFLTKKSLLVQKHLIRFYKRKLTAIEKSLNTSKLKKK